MVQVVNYNMTIVTLPQNEKWKICKIIFLTTVNMSLVSLQYFKGDSGAAPTSLNSTHGKWVSESERNNRVAIPVSVYVQGLKKALFALFAANPFLLHLHCLSIFASHVITLHDLNIWASCHGDDSSSWPAFVRKEMRSHGQQVLYNLFTRKSKWLPLFLFLFYFFLPIPFNGNGVCRHGIPLS